MAIVYFLIGFIIALFIPSPIDTWLRDKIKTMYNKIKSWFIKK